MNHTKDLSGYLVIAIIVAAVCAVGWYSAATSSKNLNITYEDQISEYETKIDEYKAALEEANSNIEDVNSCVSSAEDNVDYGIDAVLEELCSAETVSEP